MRNLLKVIGNTALIVGGFFVVLFGTSKVLNHDSQGGAILHNELGAGVAHADAPADSAASAASAASADCAGSGGSGSSDSGGGGK